VYNGSVNDIFLVFIELGIAIIGLAILTRLIEPLVLRMTKVQN
jgi:hypothetical protein